MDPVPWEEIIVPTCSYVVFSKAGQKRELVEELSTIPEAELQPAEQENVVLLLTETRDMEAQKELEDRLEEIEPIQALAQTFGEIVPDEGEVEKP